MMVTYGAALPFADHAWMAVQTALEMRCQLEILNQTRRKQNKYPKYPIEIGIRIDTSPMITGCMGASRFMQFTAIGDGVNFASRLEGLSKFFGCNIVISDSTYQAWKDKIWVRELDSASKRPQKYPMSIYELIGLRSEPISNLILQTIELIELYHQGLYAMRQGDYEKAN